MSIFDRSNNAICEFVRQFFRFFFLQFLFCLQRLLSELETKYKSLMIMNSSMFNEKQSLNYQLDAYKDQLDEHFETFQQVKRQLREKSRVKLDFCDSSFINFVFNIHSRILNCKNKC